MILVIEGKALKSTLEEFYIFEKIENILFHVHITIGEELFRQDNLVALHSSVKLAIIFFFTFRSQTLKSKTYGKGWSSYHSDDLFGFGGDRSEVDTPSMFKVLNPALQSPF